MNRSEIRALARFWLNEASEGFFRDSDLNVLINVSNQKLNTLVAALKEDYFTTSVTFPTVSGTKSYTLPTDFRALRRIEHYNASDPGDIQKISKWHFPNSELGDDWPFTASGRPTQYIIRGTQLDLYPIPDAVYTLRLYYDQRKANLTGDAEIPSSPLDFHDMIALDVAVLARQKNQEDASDLRVLYNERRDELITAFADRDGAEADKVEGYLE